MHTKNRVSYSIKCIQQNVQMFQYTILYLKRYASNIFRPVLDHLQEGTKSLNYV
jgi:hypothetical protein